MEFVAYGGWDRCVRLVSGDVEAIVTVEVGPRIIRFGFIGEKNEFHENPGEMGQKGGDQYHSYGGHRLWYAPEDKIETYCPENDPVEVSEDDAWLVFTPKPNRFGMQKELRVRADGTGFQLDHRVTNIGASPANIAPWAITVMAGGGVCMIPQKAYRPFPEILTPVSSIALWGYTDMADPRFTFGRHLIELRHDRNLGPTKIGTLVSQGYATYLNCGSLFIKRFDVNPEAEYPDRGSNFEAFTRQDVLEVESLAPMANLDPGQTAAHRESWRLCRNVVLPEEREVAAANLAAFADY